MNWLAGLHFLLFKNCGMLFGAVIALALVILLLVLQALRVEC
jgi:tetrahydromethanopterin S-methyltransferase subunit G